MNLNSPATYLKCNQAKLDNECNALGFHFDMTWFMRAADELSLTKNTTGNNASRPWYVTVNGHRFEKTQVHFQLASKMLSYSVEGGAAPHVDDGTFVALGRGPHSQDDERQVHDAEEFMSVEAAALLLLDVLSHARRLAQGDESANGTRGTRGAKRARGCNELNMSIQELNRSIQELLKSNQELLRSNQELNMSIQELKRGNQEPKEPM